MSIKEKLIGIEQKIRHLGNDNARLKKELNRQQIENNVLKQKLVESQKTINELENKNVHLHIAKADNVNDEASERIRKKIDQYIKEIDKCIELLNS